MKSKLSFLFLLAFVLDAGAQSVPTNYPVVPFSSVTAQSVASNQDALLLYHWTGSNYINRRISLPNGLTNFFLPPTNSGGTFSNGFFSGGTFRGTTNLNVISTNPVVSGGTFSGTTNLNVISTNPVVSGGTFTGTTNLNTVSTNPVISGGTLVNQTNVNGVASATFAANSLMSSNQALRAALVPLANIKLQKPLLGFEPWSELGTNETYSTITNYLGHMIAQGGLQSGYNTLFLEGGFFYGFTNLSGATLPLVDPGKFPSAGELGGGGLDPLITNFLWPNGINLGVYTSSSLDANQEVNGDASIGPWWDSFYQYMETNYGATAFLIDPETTTTNADYIYEVMRVANALANSSNPFVWTRIAGAGTNGWRTPEGSVSFSDGFLQPYFNEIRYQAGGDPLTYAAWLSSWNYAAHRFQMGSRGHNLGLNAIWFDGGRAFGGPGWSTMFQMQCMIHSDLELGYLDGYHWGSDDLGNDAWTACNPSLIAVDQCDLQAMPVKMAATNGVEFWVEPENQNSWYVAAWNTSSVQVASVTVPIQLLGLPTNTVLTLRDLRQQCDVDFITNTFTITQGWTGGENSGSTNLAPWGTTIYEVKNGKWSDWRAGTNFLSQGFMVWGTNQQASQNIFIGQNRDGWNSFYPIAPLTINGITPTNYLRSLGPTATKFFTWPATNFSFTMTDNGGYGFLTNYVLLYTNDVFWSSNGAGGSSPVTFRVNSSLPPNVKTVTIQWGSISANSGTEWNAIIDPQIICPFGTIYSGTNLLRVAGP